MKNAILGLAFIFIGILVQSQDIAIPKQSKRYILEILNIDGRDQVFRSNEFQWYGLDFSNALLVNARKMNKDQDALIKYTYFREWNKMFEKKVDRKRITSDIGKDSINVHTDYFQETQLLKVNEERVIVGSPQYFDLKKLSEIVEDYDLQETTGIGMSVIIENLNKYDETVTGFFLFFDVGSREILWTAKTSGPAGGKGMTSHWWDPIFAVYGYFIKYYNVEKKLITEESK